MLLHLVQLDALPSSVLSLVYRHRGHLALQVRPVLLTLPGLLVPRGKHHTFPMGGGLWGKGCDQCGMIKLVLNIYIYIYIIHTYVTFHGWGAGGNKITQPILFWDDI